MLKNAEKNWRRCCSNAATEDFFPLTTDRASSKPPRELIRNTTRFFPRNQHHKTIRNASRTRMCITADRQSTTLPPIGFLARVAELYPAVTLQHVESSEANTLNAVSQNSHVIGMIYPDWRFDIAATRPCGYDTIDIPVTLSYHHRERPPACKEQNHIAFACPGRGFHSLRQLWRHREQHYLPILDRKRVFARQTRYQ